MCAGVAVAVHSVPAYIMFAENGQLARDVFLKMWSEIPDTSEVNLEVKDRTVSDVEAVKARCVRAACGVWLRVAPCAGRQRELTTLSVACAGCAACSPATCSSSRRPR